MKYYKHKYFPIVVILILGLIRYLIKITYDFENFIFIHNYSVYLLFLFIQNLELTVGIYAEILDKGNSFIIFLVELIYILEIFAILVFQENIDLNLRD